MKPLVKYNIIPQDIGRVLLNLYNNAFYAVSEKSVTTELASKYYEPTVSVSTKKETDKVEITVKDNGNGIPQKLLIKSFNPSLPQSQPGREPDWV